MASSLSVVFLIYLIRTIVFISEFLSLPIYAIIYRPIRRFFRTREAKGFSPSGDPGGPFRSAELAPKEALWAGAPTTSPLYKFIKPSDTLADIWRHASQVFADRDCMGTRDFVAEEDELQPNGKVFKKLVLGDYRWKNYKQTANEVDQLAAAFRSLGVKPEDRIVILAETRAEWMQSALACFQQNFVVVTLYSTLGEDAIVHGLTETDPIVIVTTAEIVSRMRKIKDRIPESVRAIIYCQSPGTPNPFRTSSPSTSDVSASNPSGQTFFGKAPCYTFNEALEMGKKALAQNQLLDKKSKATLDSLAVILYTSGTTGVPKGVLLTHGNFISTIGAAIHRYRHLLEGRNRGIGYLPLAHVLELEVELALLAIGTPIGYASPLTLIDGASKLKKGVRGDVNILKPTVMAAVPAVVDRITKAIWEKVQDSKNEFLKEFFMWAFRHKRRRFRRGFDTPILNYLIFRKTKMVLGGELHTMLSGGAPLTQEALEFMTICMCCFIGQGYGLTETCGVCTIPSSNDSRFLPRVGAPIGNCEIMLRDWPEGGYTSQDLPNARGEVLVSGYGITSGYYKNKRATDEAFVDINGIRWFCTGDIGMMHSDGTLQIVDRKKDLLKLQGGEYVALGKVEAILTATVRYIEYICVIGKSTRDFVVAIIVPKRDAIKQLAKQLAIEFTAEAEATSSGIGIGGSVKAQLGLGEQVPMKANSYEELFAHPRIVESVQKSISEAAIKSGLVRFEIPQRVCLVSDLWMPGFMLTDALKLKRREISTHYAREIEVLYEEAQL